jgi:hypothetical protein
MFAHKTNKSRKLLLETGKTDPPVLSRPMTVRGIVELRQGAPPPSKCVWMVERFEP